MATTTAHEDISPTTVRPNVAAFDDESQKQSSSWRRPIGFGLLAIVVVAWTASGFLTSSVFADSTYSKPYLVTYVNTSFFSLPLIPLFLKRTYQKGSLPSFSISEAINSLRGYLPVQQNGSKTSLLGTERTPARSRRGTLGGTLENQFESEAKDPDAPLTTRDHFHLSAKFCGLWFFSGWLNAASFENTSVASSTILVSTSSVFALLFGSILGVEKFTINKLVGVMASLGGIIMVSLVDTSSKKDDDSRGSFPYKSPGQIALGDCMALLSAVFYGLYATVLTKNIGDESKVNMPLFFGFIGTIAFTCLWPGFVILSLFGWEPFELPPTSHVALVVIANASVSLVSDICWAYAVLLTSPLVVTVGLTLTIPLSLVGQMIINSQYSSPLYWVGAAIIIFSFVFISHTTKDADTPENER
ncbi:MAG: hypothetical protein M1831_004380 [Alyxoria varia]|nr:MAG: hypothetical protein M1831_004380 [Alyxoria varia]